ncbi:uncharacterized protein LOC144574221 [Carex rostrata]
MKRTSLHPVVIALALYLLLVISNAVPSSRSKGLLQEKGISSLSDTPKAIIDDASIEELVTKGRMDIEINDYPPSGANNRHTPKPPGNF